MFHAFLGERLPDWRSAAALVRKIAENYKLPYYTMSPTYSVCRNHGYINGEVYECPDCHQETEVYSRITGYYRPVKNWNDGKAQEFKDRREYQVEHSHMHHEGCDCGHDHTHAEEEQPAATVTAGGEDKLILFATRTCPNCRMARTFLDNAGLEYEEVFADENEELSDAYGVRQAPTLIVQNGDTVEKIVNVSNIRKYINEVAAKRG